jgi:hypothetical protein
LFAMTILVVLPISAISNHHTYMNGAFR